jgi:N-acetylglucosaminyldiphosphoundecaprenol N-acetyl-beta-D-mannosaminyltransferase
MNGGKPELLGARFEPLTMTAAVARCVAWCETSRASHTIVTANASHLCMKRRDRELRNACDRADMLVADGMSVVWALRAAGTPLPERIAGVDLMAELLAAAGGRHLRVYFLGARPEVVAKLARDCEQKYRGLVIAGCRDGYFSRGDDATIAEEIRQAAPHMLFVGMPSPFKEVWCERYRRQLCVPVIVGVGGSFDVLAGFIQRAPRLVQSLGMEWFWRLMMEPRKLWKRYLLSNSEFLWLAGREILGRRIGRRVAAGRLEGTHSR